MADSNSKADDKSQSAPKLEDKFLNTVFGNVLDEAVNTSYNLKLYMIKDRTSGGGGYVNGAKAAKPEETVVIAQTGVTGVQMDGLTLDFVKDKGNHFAVAANFTLIQPGAADLLDQIQAAKVHLGIEAGMYADVPLFLEINFKGYASSLDEEDGAGEPIHVCGPFIYKLTLAKISIAIDDKGSEYEVMCTVGTSNATVDNYFRIPMDTSVSGSTITELVDELQANIKRFREENLTDNDVQDEIEFDIDQLIQTLGDETIVYDIASQKAAEQVNRLMNAESQGITTKEDFEKALEDDPDSLDGGASVNAGIFRNNRINFKEGTDINKFFTTILVMNKKFLEKVNRKINLDDPDMSEDNYDLKKAYTKWYKIEAEMEYLDYDTSRNKYAQKVTYQPMMYDTANELTMTSSVEAQPGGDNVKSRVKEINESKNLLKAYHYLYTGLNDQILNADIKFDAGQILLLAPGGGKMGDMSTNPNSTAPTAEEAADDKAKNEKAEREGKQLDVSGVKQALKNDPSLRQRLKDKGVATQEDLDRMDNDDKLAGDFAKTAVYLANNGKDPLGFKDQLVGKDASSNSPTESDDQRSGGGIKTYKPEPSGFLYASDILADAGGIENVIGENQSLTTLRQAANKSPSAEDEDTSPITKTESSKSIVTDGSATNDGTSSATLFGYMFNNVQDAAILVNMDIGLKGDPWYLGEPTTYEEARVGRTYTGSLEKANRSKPEGVSYDFDDNYFLFTMQTPRVRDPDIDEEDNNTGYMDKAGTSYFISGVYMISRVSTVFNGGMFTCDVTGHKQTGLSLAHLMEDISKEGGPAAQEKAEAEAERKAQEEAKINEQNTQTPTESGQGVRDDSNIPEGTTVTETTTPDGVKVKTVTKKTTTYFGAGQPGQDRATKKKPVPFGSNVEDDF